MGALDSSAVQNTIRFGDYELDLKAGVLRKKGLRLRCQEQPLQVLAALAERPGEVLTREDLRRRVWPKDTFVDFDHALNTAIKKVRAVLNDDADAPRYIETVPRRGYRFIGEVGEKTVATSIVAPSVNTIPRRTLAILGVAIALLAILGTLWGLASWKGNAATTPEFQRLTFDPPQLGVARFTPDGASVVYCAGWPYRSMSVYTQRLDAPGPRELGINITMLLAISPHGELAVLGGGSNSVMRGTSTGTLARVPLEGGTPRELLASVQFADWSPTGQLAVVRRIEDKSRLEFPVGRVLYESTGWISAPRFSPRGDVIAFLDHPAVMDDRGLVMMVDLNGQKKMLSGFWESLRGLAWNPRGDEVWFAATRSGAARQLYATGLNGGERRVLNVAGGVSLQDISREGRVLLSRDNERLGILFMEAGASVPRELSWKDFSIAMDISPDGKRILFGEQGEKSGPSYQVGLRATDGSAPVILGPGVAQSLSPDNQWALSIMPPPDEQMVLLPTGAGSPRTLERGAIEHYQRAKAKWLPDGKRILFVGREAGHGSRCYVQAIEGGNPQAFTPEGTLLCSVSPSGQILALGDDSRALLYNSYTSARPYKELSFNKGEFPGGWTADGKFIYLVQTLAPATITKFEVLSGRRIPWKQLELPAAEARELGEMTIKMEAVAITPDGQSYAYTYGRHSSDLYLVQGLK